VKLLTEKRRPLAAVAIFLVFGALYGKLLFSPQSPDFKFSTEGERATRAAKPRYEVRNASHGGTRSVHSAAAVETESGRLLAFWYGGTREGARDVALYSSVFSPQTRQWGPETVVLTREQLQGQLRRNIRKLGNPVILRDARNRLWLFFVSVSLGGWSGSAINLMMSDDEGRSWGPARRLVSSPFLNVSTLVKGSPFLYSDQSVGLPVYHEFLGKFGEILRLDPDGNVLSKSRLSWGRYSIQPEIVPTSPQTAVGFMRYTGEPPFRILMFNTEDAGHQWSEPWKIDLPNPNAAVDSLRLANGDLLLVFNNIESSREDLSLAYSRDQGRTWKVIHEVENERVDLGLGPREFSYPWLTRTRDGEYHLFYTWRRTHIRHVTFNQSWLEKRL
jgi:predicted neuraminidase